MPDFSYLPTWIYWSAFGLLLFIAGVLLEPVGLIEGILLFLIGIPPVAIEKGCKKAREVLVDKVIPELLRFPAGLVSGHTEVANIISRLVLLTLAGGAIDGEVINLEALLPFVNGTAGGSSTINIDWASVAIFIAVPALMFAFAAEFWDLIPEEFYVFKRLDNRNKLKIALRCASTLFCMMAVIAGILLWVYKAIYLSHPEAIQDPTAPVQGLPFNLMFSLADIQLWLFYIIGCLFVISMFLAFAIAIPGMLGLAATVCGVLVVVSFIPEVPAWIVIEILSILCYFLTRRRFGPRSKIPDMHLPQGLPANLKLPWDTKIVDEIEDTVQTLAIGTGGTIPMDDKVAAVLFGGTDGSRAFPAFDKAKQELQAPVRISGCVNTRSENHLVMQGTIDAGPTLADKMAIINNGARGDEVKRQSYELMGDKVIDECLKISHVPGPVFAVIDKHDLPHTTGMFSRIAASLPDNPALLITFISQHEYGTPIATDTRNLISQLWTDGDIAAALILDERAFSHASLFDHTPRALMKLLRLKKDYPLNISAVEVLDIFSRNGSPFIAVRHDSDTIAAGQIPARRSWIRWFGMKKGAGYINNMVTRTEQLITQLEKQPEKGTVAVPISRRVTSFILTTLPILKTEKAKLSNTTRQIDAFVHRNYSPTYTLYARAAGEPTRERAPSEYMVSVSWFFTVLMDAFEPTEETPKLPPVRTSRALPQPVASATISSDQIQKATPVPDTTEDEPEEVPAPTDFEALPEIDTTSQPAPPTNNGTGKTGRGRPRKQAKS